MRIAMDTATNLEGTPRAHRRRYRGHRTHFADVAEDSRGAKLSQACAPLTLLDKAHRVGSSRLPIDYRGFEVGDEFLLGYGLDWGREVPQSSLVVGRDGPRSFQRRS